MMDYELFNREDTKYSDLWQDDYKEAHWKRLAKGVLSEVKLSGDIPYNMQLIDFGFGRGSTLEFFSKKGFYVAGNDISAYAVRQQLQKGREVYHSSLDDLSVLRSKRFHIGFSNDVLEHLPEDLIHPSLSEMSRVTSKYLFLSVCPKPSHHKSLGGEPLHLTVKPLAWWEEQLSVYGEVKELKFIFSRSGRYIVKLNK